MSFLLLVFVVTGIFAVCILAMCVGLFIRGQIIRKSCGSEVALPDGTTRCGTCGSEKRGDCYTDPRAAAAKAAAQGANPSL